MKKIFLFTIIITISSCSYFYPDKQNKIYIRIVDSNGKPKKVKTFPPELNIRYLAVQEEERFDAYDNNKATPLEQKQYEIPDIKDNLINQNNQTYIEQQPPILAQQYNDQQSQHNITENKTEVAPIIYQINDQDIIKSNEPKKDKIKKPSKNKIKKGDLLIQIASFNNKIKAISAQKKENIKNSRIISVKMGKRTYHKLVVGPFKNKKIGNVTLNKLKRLGHRDAFYYKFK